MRRRAVQRLHPLDGVDVDRHQRGLPVVAVDDVGDEAERLAQLQRAARQEREALQVVGVALGRRAVEIRAVEVAVDTRGSRPAPRCRAACRRARARAPRPTTSAPTACRPGPRARSRACRRRAASPPARRSPARAAPSAARPTTSASPPVLAKGAHSDETNRTLRMAAGPASASAGVDTVVDLREDVVARLDVGQPALVHLGAPQIVVEPVELQDVLVDAPGGVGDGRARSA